MLIYKDVDLCWAVGPCKVPCAGTVYLPLKKYVGHLGSHLPPIVYTEDFDLSPELSLYMCFEVFEIINKCKHVPCFVDGWMRKGSHQIIVDELQR